jgi:hypothetical protein
MVDDDIEEKKIINTALLACMHLSLSIILSFLFLQPTCTYFMFLFSLVLFIITTSPSSSMSLTLAAQEERKATAMCFFFFSFSLACSTAQRSTPDVRVEMAGDLVMIGNVKTDGMSRVLVPFRHGRVDDRFFLLTVIQTICVCGGIHWLVACYTRCLGSAIQLATAHEVRRIGPTAKEHRGWARGREDGWLPVWNTSKQNFNGTMLADLRGGVRQEKSRMKVPKRERVKIHFHGKDGDYQPLIKAGKIRE